MTFRTKLILIVLLCVGLRLLSVNTPLIGAHSWRQCDTAGVARNFYEEGMRFFYPRVDWRGEGPGYVEMEFPAFSYAAACCYWVVGGVHEWMGRALAALGAGVCVWWLGALVAMRSDERTGLWSAFFFAVLPLNVYYGQAFMPESWMLAASVGGVLYFARWSGVGEARARSRNGIASALLVALACLLKLPTLFIGLPLAYLAWERWRWAFLKRPTMWLYAAFVFASVGAWYWHAHSLAGITGLSFGIWATGKAMSWPITFSWHYWYLILIQRLTVKHLAYAGTVIAIVGICTPRKRREERLFDAWSIGVAVFLAVVSWGNTLHEYYQMPAMLPLSFYLGRVMALGWKTRKWLWGTLLAACLVLSTGKVLEYARDARRERSPEWGAAELLKTILTNENRNAVVVASVQLPGDPTVLYLAGAKGWAVAPLVLSEAGVADLAHRGARLVVVVRGDSLHPGSSKDEQAVIDLCEKWPVGLEKNSFGVVIRLPGP